MTPKTVSPAAARNSRPYLHGQEIEAITHVLRQGHYGHTEETDRFEQRIAAYLGVPDAVAVASGTAALHIALHTAGVGPGDEVIVPSLTYCATIQAILAVGAQPRFIDVSTNTLCVTSDHVRDALSPATRAVVPVLYGGRAVDLSPIAAELADRDVTIIEDAAHAFGSRLREDFVGATGALTCFSFGPIKNLTCGQGGMIIPRTPEESTAARGLRGLGIAGTPRQRAAATSYTVDGFGYRLIMSALNAAIGNAQLDHFPQIAAQRRHLWRTYAAALAEVDGATLVDVNIEDSVPHLCVVRVPERDKVFSLLRGRGVGVGVHYPPNHTQPAFAAWNRHLPVTDHVGGEILSLPFHLDMTETDIHEVTAVLWGTLNTCR